MEPAAAEPTSVESAEAGLAAREVLVRNAAMFEAVKNPRVAAWRCVRCNESAVGAMVKMACEITPIAEVCVAVHKGIAPVHKRVASVDNRGAA
jgi:hypothetical protein